MDSSLPYAYSDERIKRHAVVPFFFCRHQRSGLTFQWRRLHVGITQKALVKHRSTVYGTAGFLIQRKKRREQIQTTINLSFASNFIWTELIERCVFYITESADNPVAFLSKHTVLFRLWRRVVLQYVKAWSFYFFNYLYFSHDRSY